MSQMSKAAIIRAGGILGGAGVLFVGGLLVASAPAFADNGPHVSMANGSVTTQGGIGGALGGGCASCHRAHSAQATTDLLKTSDEVALCTSCHGPTGNGATTDVLSGVAFTATTDPTTGDITHTNTGALRGGGFDSAALKATDAARGPYVFNAAKNRYSIDKLQNSIGVLTDATTGLVAPEQSTSNHGVGDTATIWGNGVFSANANYGKADVTLECSSCHDPHGNGNFRILKSVPSDSGTVLPTVASVDVAGSTVTYNLTTPYPLAVGQTVTITGSNPTTYNIVKATIASVGTADTKTFAVPSITLALPGAPGVYVSGGTITPTFPDVAPGTQVYTTTNYWKEDPAGTPASTQSPLNGASKSSFIANISQWCSTCHTRYLSTSGGTSRTVDSGDAVYKYRHTSASGSQDSPNCLTCHVAHGTNAPMSALSGAGTTGADSPGDSMAKPPTGDHSSKLLRVANRGVCQMCHNK
jgi:predicted CXXCH cytochrome family protein